MENGNVTISGNNNVTDDTSVILRFLAIIEKQASIIERLQSEINGNIKDGNAEIINE